MLFEWSELIAEQQLGPVLLSLLFFCISLVANYLGGVYASARVSNPVTDLILNHLPVVDSRIISLIFVEGAMLLWVFIAFLTLSRPKRLAFALSSIALFTTIRAFFVILTHLAPYATDVAVYSSNPIISKIVFKGDLFFSGHTGLPFLLALMFWPNVGLRRFFLITSVIFAATVLLGRLHYSVDVFGAYFITYTIFALSQWLFPAYYRRLRQAV